jgi:shikimate 5-dehydrogenase
MLVGQAAESFAIWRNVKPEVETVISHLRNALSME